MKMVNDYKGKDVLVLGLAKSGYTAAKLLHQLGAKVTVNDRSNLKEDEKALELKGIGINIVDGGHPEGLITESLTMVVKNPGIPYNNPLIVKAITQSIPVITEVELASQISEAEFIGITGSNGKTTTTMLLGEMMKGSRLKPIVAGNIGTVMSEVAQEANKYNVIVAELSSFQLMGIEEFHPHVAIILNLFEAHLDYHGTLEAYGRAKARITLNQTADDILIYNADQPIFDDLLNNSKAIKIPVSISGKVRTGAYLLDDALYFRDDKIIDSELMSLKGLHNRENALAAIAAAKAYDVPTEYLKNVLSSFSGVEHRLAFIAEKSGRLFYNDSKATNILATSRALDAFQQPVILLAGGLDRGNSFDALIPSLDHVKAVVTFGETKEKIKEAAVNAGIKAIYSVENVEEAVPVAYNQSVEGDVILLSPACASWDQYRSFEERGDMFIKAVHKLK